MKHLILREPTIDDESIVMDFRNEFLPESDHIPGSAALGKFKTFEEWLESVELDKFGRPERDMVASTQYMAIDEESGRLVGCIQLRHSLNKYLEDFGGHIGYSIRPTERRKGYASEMLQLCLKKAADLDIANVLITCDDTNAASEAVIRKAGGIYEDIRIEQVTGPKKRFWVSTSK